MFRKLMNTTKSILPTTDIRIVLFLLTLVLFILVPVLLGLLVSKKNFVQFSIDVIRIILFISNLFFISYFF